MNCLLVKQKMRICLTYTRSVYVYINVMQTTLTKILTPVGNSIFYP